MMFNALWLKSFGFTRKAIDIVLSAPTELEFEHPAFAAVAVLQLVLAARARHTLGTIVGLFTSAVLCAKHASIDLPQLPVQIPLPPHYVRLALAAYVVALLLVRLLTLKKLKTYSKGFPVSVTYPLGCTRVARDFVYRAKGDRFKALDVTAKELHDISMQWVGKQWDIRVVKDSPKYIYCTGTSVVFGLPDNVAIRVVELGPRQSGLEVQAEIGIGHGDFFANLERVKSLLRYAEGVAQKKR